MVSVLYVQLGIVVVWFVVDWGMYVCSVVMQEKSLVIFVLVFVLVIAIVFSVLDCFGVLLGKFDNLLGECDKTLASVSLVQGGNVPKVIYAITEVEPRVLKTTV